MKKLIAILTVFSLIAFALPAFAATTVSKVPFANITGSGEGVKYSAVINTTGYKTKTMTVAGATALGVAADIDGTVLAQCAPTPTGPWTTCTQSQVASAPAVSLTADNQLTWIDAVAYVRLKWTSGVELSRAKA